MARIALRQRWSILCHKLSRLAQRQRPSKIAAPSTEKQGLEPMLFKFSMELLLQIFSHLPLPSRVCLALSCKDLYDLFGWVLKAEELRFPGLRTMGKPLSTSDRWYIKSREYHLRMKLLSQLEDSKWTCCAYCQKLHPREEFDAMYRLIGPCLRRCNDWAGILDICPCISMTIRDRAHVVKYLMRKSTDDRIARRFIDTGLFKDSANDQGGRCLLHECRAYSAVQAVTILTLTEGNRLRAYYWYKLPTNYLISEMVPVWLCPTKWLSLMRNSDTWHCPSCSSDITKLTDSNTPDMTVVNVRRPLGIGEWPRATGYLRLSSQYTLSIDMTPLLNTNIPSYEALIAN